MSRILTPNLIAIVAASALLNGSAGAAEPDPGLFFFEKRIRPVLVEHCYKCHSADKKKQGGLLLDSRAGARKGGDSGPAVVPSKPEESLLLSAMRYETFEMPPKGKLPANVIRDFERWIRTGAPDSREGGTAPVEANSPSVEEGRSFWAFQPVRDEPAPKVKDAAWARSKMDRLILARLEAKGLRPVRDASPEVLLRRLSFDLMGLPPTPEELKQFLAVAKTDRDKSVAVAVNRMLDSPQFGERWGRHWLDVVRFAESSGGGRTRIFDHAWRYRDYVVDSFNQDKPFEQFVKEQIAGDLLKGDSGEDAAAALTATSFLSIAPTNYELQDKELLDMDVVDEQLTVTGKAFLSMTIGCARCHDHKFDPIPTRDYYALAGIFKSTKTLNHANVSNPIMRKLPLDAETKTRIADHAHQIEPLKKEIAALELTLKKLSKVPGAGRLTLHNLLGVSADESGESRVQGESTVLKPGTVKRTGPWKESTSNPGFVGNTYHFSNEQSSRIEYSFPLGKPATLEVRLSYTASSNRAAKVPVTVRHRDGETVRHVDMKKKPTIDGSFVSLGTFEFDKSAFVLISAEGTSGVVIADAVQLLPIGPVDAKTKTDAPKKPRLTRARSGVISEPETPLARDRRLAKKKLAENRRNELRAEVKELEKNAPPPAPVVMSVTEQEKPGDCALCIRGNVHNPGPIVPRGFLSVITGDDQPELADGSSGRLELAEWIAHGENPLTARVYVNRVWYWLFGTGLVRSVDNFGRMGELPSHPRLLDHLAVEFVRNGWSTKKLIRQIVHSRTYQLSSEASPEAVQLDPENRLLSYSPRKRLDAESIRDAVLAVSGQLDLTTGGSTIKPGSTTEFGYRFNVSNLDGRRRSIYVPVFRNTLLDLFAVFDFADPNLVFGRRTTSTLPTQALYFLNSPWVNQQAQHAALRVVSFEGSREQRIEFAHRLFFGRPPKPAERQLTEDYLSGANSREEQLTAWRQLCQALYASVDFRFVR